MTPEHYPNDDDQRALLEAQEVLAASGVAAAPSGYDLTTLAAAVYALTMRDEMLPRFSASEMPAPAKKPTPSPSPTPVTRP